MRPNEHTSFWLSYSGLFLALFFIFLLIFGALSAKLVFLQDGTKAINQAIEEDRKALLLEAYKLEKEQQTLLDFISEINATNELLASKISLSFLKLKEDSNETADLLSRKESEINQLKLSLSKLESKLNEARQKEPVLMLDQSATKTNQNILKIIANLKIRLKDTELSEKIDAKTGSLALSADKFFDGSALKNEDTLKSLIEPYFAVLLDPEIFERVLFITVAVPAPKDIDDGLLALERASALAGLIYAFKESAVFKDKLVFAPLSAQNEFLSFSFVPKP
ncbi:MAG: PspA/IM30 family protein [Campylobacter sp.]|nr:PspA/IM30 family protein [Campylobacter sp.]